MQIDRAQSLLRKALAGAFAASLLLAAVPAVAQAHNQGGGRPSGGSRGGYRGASSGGYRGAPSGGYRGPSGGYRSAPSGGYRGYSPSSYRGYNPGTYNPGYRGGTSTYRSVPTYRGGYSGDYRGAPAYRGSASYIRGGNYGRVNAYYVRNPGAYGGGWRYDGGRSWYDGYWHNYWGAANWLWWGGHYGFWFPFNGANVFVYEVSPDVCQYWDGNEWVPYYDPNTGYYCPYYYQGDDGY